MVRQIFHSSKSLDLKSVIKPILQKENPFNITTPKDLIDYLKENRRKNLKHTENGYYKTDYTLHWKVNRHIIKKNWKC